MPKFSLATFLFCIKFLLYIQSGETFAAKILSTTTDDITREILDERSKTTPHDFIEPEDHDNQVTKFVLDDREFLFVQKLFPYTLSDIICRILYHGHLAFIKEEKVASFLAEALSETDMLFDTLWVGGTRETHLATWKWVKQNYSEEISQELVETFVTTPQIPTYNRLCLGFGRENHDGPQFRPLACSSFRNMICQRITHIDEGSTHKGWIQIDNRLFKIFTREVAWRTALANCMNYDADASLAVVVTFKQCKHLSRYLLIGRPSLENAWIGANYNRGSYQFPAESLILGNVTNEKGYPPWMNGAMRYKHGCLLLDRHLWATTLFVETRCNRKKPYICYKFKNGRSKFWTDVIISEYGYRLHYNEKTWVESRDYCAERYKNYNSKLVEITEKPIFYHLLYLMGENSSAVQHIWLGGRWNESTESWMWDKSEEVISTGSNAILNWVVNTTFTSNAEKDNKCLNMDRENHVVALHYGTSCGVHQPFVCQFTKENLNKLREEEKQETKMTDTN